MCLVIEWLAGCAMLKGSVATSLDGMGGDVVSSAFCSRTNQTTSHVTTKLAAVAKKKINDRFIMFLLLPGDRDIGRHRGVARPQKSDKLWYFANDADSCNRVLSPNLR